MQPARHSSLRLRYPCSIFVTAILLQQICHAADTAGPLLLSRKGRLLASSSPNPAQQQQQDGSSSSSSSSSVANPCWNPGTYGNGGSEFLTVDSRCPDDKFNIAILETNDTWVWLGEDAGQYSDVYFTQGWATTDGFVQNQFLRPRPVTGSSSEQYVAVLRVRDRKLVVPKGVDLNDRKLVDISSSKLRGCVLVGEQSERPFPRFRLVVKADGSNRVLANSVAAMGVPIFKGRDGIKCEELHEDVIGYGGGSDKAKGQLMDFYKPPGCKFVIDDCSQ